MSPLFLPLFFLFSINSFPFFDNFDDKIQECSDKINFPDSIEYHHHVSYQKECREAHKCFSDLRESAALDESQKRYVQILENHVAYPCKLMHKTRCEEKVSDVPKCVNVESRGLQVEADIFEMKKHSYYTWPDDECKMNRTQMSRVREIVETDCGEAADLKKFSDENKFCHKGLEHHFGPRPTITAEQFLANFVE